jgi:hypothetical protein
VSIVSSFILSDDTRIATLLEAHARAQQQLQSPASLRVLIDGGFARGCTYSWPQVDASCDLLAAAIDGVSEWLPLSSLSLERVMLTPRVVDWIAQLLRRSQSLDTFSICARVSCFVALFGFCFFLNCFRHKHSFVRRAVDLLPREDCARVAECSCAVVVGAH